MFRLLRLKPPHGWKAVTWELAIVVAGVVIALGVQQWADQRSAKVKADKALSTIRDDAWSHYLFAVEWRTVEPCINAQIDQLSERLARSNATIVPAPVFSEPGFDSYVLRIPNRIYSKDAWQAALYEGVTGDFPRATLRNLIAIYARFDTMNAANELNNVAYSAVFGLSRPLPIDASSRLQFMRLLDEMRSRVEYMGLIATQIIANLDEAGLSPNRKEIVRELQNGGTVRFCQTRKLPLRNISEATGSPAH